MNDLISRQAAIDALDKTCNAVCQYSKKQRYVMCGACPLGSAFDMLCEVPSVQERKKGRWIEQEDYNLDTYYDCSVCGESWCTVDGTPWENGMNYCPNCGAKMEGAEE